MQEPLECLFSWGEPKVDKVRRIPSRGLWLGRPVWWFPVVVFGFVVAAGG